MLIRPAATLAACWSDGPAGAADRFLPAARPVVDGRRPYLPDMADASEPGLTERWAGFDGFYRSRGRLGRFWAAELVDAVVHPPFGIVTVGDAVVRETVTDVDRLIRTFPGLDHREAAAAFAGEDADPARSPPAPPPAIDTVDGSAFLLGWGLADNYYNWTLRYLSKVGQWQRGAGDQALLVPTPRRPFVDAGLDALDVPQGAVRHLTAATRVRRLTLTAPNLLNRHALAPRLIDLLRHHPAVERRWRGPARALYLPRGRTGLRRVVNEGAVMDALARRGMVAFDAGGQAMEAQIRAFRDASLVVAPHGAALANIVWCRPGTPVVEIVPEGYDQGVTSYRSLADLFGLPYRQMMAREAGPAPNNNRCNSPMAVSIPHLHALLDEVAPGLIPPAAPAACPP